MELSNLNFSMFVSWVQTHHYTRIDVSEDGRDLMGSNIRQVSFTASCR